MKKSTVIKFASALMLIVFTTVSASDVGPKTIEVYENISDVYYNKRKIYLENFNYNGTTFVNLRSLLKALKYDVLWNDATKEITINKEEQPVEITKQKPEDAIYVKRDELIENPDKYDGKYVWVSGFWDGTVSGDEEILYIGEIEFDKNDTKRALELDFYVSVIIETFVPNDNLDLKSIENNGSYVVLRGIFRKNSINENLAGRIEKIDDLDLIL